VLLVVPVAQSKEIEA
jgi:hypothetical protein